MELKAWHAQIAPCHNQFGLIVENEVTVGDICIDVEKSLNDPRYESVIEARSRRVGWKWAFDSVRRHVTKRFPEWLGRCKVSIVYLRKHRWQLVVSNGGPTLMVIGWVSTSSTDCLYGK